MTENLRYVIAKTACNATSAGKLFPWDTLNEAHQESWYKVSDAVLQVLADFGIIHRPCNCEDCK